MRRALSLIPALLLVAAAAPRLTEACALASVRCRCVPPDSGQTFEAFTRARYERADAVFQAAVVRVDSLEPVTVQENGRTWAVPRWAARLAVTAAWKGVETDTTTVIMTRDSSCDLWLEDGEQYVIFARMGRDDAYVTGQCTGTAVAASAGATLAALGPARARQPLRR